MTSLFRAAAALLLVAFAGFHSAAPAGQSPAASPRPSAPSAPALERLADEVAHEVEQLRGWTFKRAVKKERISAARARLDIQRIVLAAQTPDRPRQAPGLPAGGRAHSARLQSSGDQPGDPRPAGRRLLRARDANAQAGRPPGPDAGVRRADGARTRIDARAGRPVDRPRQPGEAGERHGGHRLRRGRHRRGLGDVADAAGHAGGAEVGPVQPDRPLVLRREGAVARPDARATAPLLLRDVRLLRRRRGVPREGRPGDADGDARQPGGRRGAAGRAARAPRGPASRSFTPRSTGTPREPISR